MMEPEPAASRVAATNAVHGAVLALGSDDTTASLVNARTGERTHHLGGLHTSSISSVALSADGAVLALGSADKTASLVNARTGERTHHLRGLWTGAIRSVALSADGAVLALGSADSTASLVNARTGERTHHLRGLHTDAIRSVALSADGAVLALGSADTTASLVNARTGERTHHLRGLHTSAISSVALSADGAVLMLGSWDSTASLVNARTGERTHSLLGMCTGAINSVALSADGAVLALGSADSTASLVLVNARTGERTHHLLQDLHTSSINSVALSADGAVLALGSADKTASLVHALTGERKHHVQGLRMGYIYSVALPADGQGVIDALTLEADSEVAAGTRIWVDGHGWGVYTGFRRNTIAANDHIIDFDASGPTAVRLQSCRWRLGSATGLHLRVVPETNDQQLAVLTRFYAQFEPSKTAPDCQGILEKRRGADAALSTPKFSKLCATLAKTYGTNPMDMAPIHVPWNSTVELDPTEARRQLVEIYTQKDQRKLANIEALLREWKGREAALLSNVRAKHGIGDIVMQPMQPTHDMGPAEGVPPPNAAAAATQRADVERHLANVAQRQAQLEQRNAADAAALVVEQEQARARTIKPIHVNAQMQQMSAPVYTAQILPTQQPEMQQAPDGAPVPVTSLTYLSPMQQQQRTGVSLVDLLTVAQLDAFRGPIEAMGVGSIEDFQDVKDEDLISCGLKIIQVRRLRRKLLEMGCAQF
jgi:WD40 repeat protein